MRLPAPLSRRNPDVCKNDFGHVLVLAGSPTMLGAAALCGLSAMRSGAGLVTVGISQSLNLTLQKKLSAVIMTLPLKETDQQTLSLSAFGPLQKKFSKFNAAAIGPGLGQNKSTQKFILKMIGQCPRPLVVDADALNALAHHLDALKKSCGVRILTPHVGEMARLVKINKSLIEKNRLKIAKTFAEKYNCVVLLKGHRTIVVDSKGNFYINHTGNAGMATAGSGDVLTGMITSFLGQGMSAFDAAKYGAFVHGKAGDAAAKSKGKIALIATDIIDSIAEVLK